LAETERDPDPGQQINYHSAISLDKLRLQGTQRRSL
jgi:hypothetical protein